MIFGGAVAAAAVVGKRALDARSKRASHSDKPRWNSVTVDLSPEEIAPGGSYPDPLADLGDAVDIRMIPGPGSWGTELGARPKAGASRTSAANLKQDVRRALRQSKTLLEAGEILQDEPKPHGKRPATPTGKLVDAWEKRAQGGGYL
ncbi:hypothetical protein GCM10027403_11900 [Arthrobacter tecti]